MTTIQTTQKKLEGPFAEARLWLLTYADDNKVKHAALLSPLKADWTPYSKAHAAYVLGVIWGRLRQINSNLEQVTEYANLVKEELKDE